ncbi:hypothetical protein T06_4222 [Trichinella sp. T6]|nr:hypothetical protein T06_4222 [Trichinella sp. T6]
MIDVSACNAYVLWTETHPPWIAGELHKRRLFLEKRGMRSFQQNIMRRITAVKMALKGCERNLSGHLTRAGTDTNRSGESIEMVNPRDLSY